MFYNINCSRFLNVFIVKNTLIKQRFLSGLNLWNEELTLPIKHKIENYWTSKLENDIYIENDTSRQKYYVLSMFPYPSGYLHMGHVRVYTISDAAARFQRMNNKNVIHPIGWDAFGLPAENAAIERQISSSEWTQQNIAYMKSQLKQLGCSFQWERELTTCDSQYYHWTQELFLKLYDNDMVYQKEAQVNWDPVDNTVLADEQVDENGCSWRSGVKVERKLLKQWFVRTTRFAKDLLEGLNDPILDDWKDITKLQRHWIGECDGVSFDFKIKSLNTNISLWTSRPEFVENAKFVALIDKHYLSKLDGIQLDNDTKRLYIKIENPFNGELLPVFVTKVINFLPMTDTHLGLPGIYEEDSSFAEKYQVQFQSISQEIDVEEKKKQICNIAKKNKFGGYWTSAKLRDWLISRQRYWGTPIPIIHCDKCGAQPVPRENLPVKLPHLKKLSSKTSSYLKECTEWLNVTCPKCLKPAKRETDTMDTFVDSSWYYLRYLDPHNNSEMFNKDKIWKMAPVDLYIGGKEHAVLHLYYARFINHFLYSLGLVPHREPFKKLLIQGMVMGRSFRVKGTGRYLPENHVEIVDLKKNKAVEKATGQEVIVSWEKMSKSKYNGVDPSNMFKEYGVDTTRLLILADVAPTSHRNWNSNTFPGIINWQKRLWLTVQEFLKYRHDPPKLIRDEKFKVQDDYMFDSRNYYVKGVTFNYYTSQQFSVAISKMQGLTNSLRRSSPGVFAHSLQFERALACQIILLTPMAPHFASELWSGFISAPGRLNTSSEILWDKTVLEQQWPEVDCNYNLDLVCQVNGQEGAVIKFPKRDMECLTKDEAVDMALKQNEIQELVKDKNILDVSFVVQPSYESVVNFHVRNIKER